MTPELSLCGYPPEDLVLRPAFLDACERELKALAGSVRRTPVAVGFPEVDRGVRYITLAHSANNRIADSSYALDKQWNGLSPFGRDVVREMNRPDSALPKF